MGKKIKKIMLSIVLVSGIFFSANLLAGTAYFNVYLPAWGEHKTIVPDIVKDNNTNGSYVRSPRNTVYQKYAFWVDQRVGNSYVQNSYTVTKTLTEILNQTGYQYDRIWLSGFVNSPLRAGHIIRLRSAGQGVLASEISGWWEYY